MKHLITEEELWTEMLLSAQKALLGAVGPNLRGCTIGWTKTKITWLCYFDGPMSDEDKELMRCVGTEIIADFPDMMIEEKMVRLDAPKKMKKLQGWAYVRKE